MTVGKPTNETMVRVYKSPKDYENDIKKLSKQGWEVLNTVNHQPQSGFVRTMSGMGLLGSKPKAEMVVTFQRMKLNSKNMKPVDAPILPPQAGFCPFCGNPVNATAFFCPNCKNNLRR